MGYPTTDFSPSARSNGQTIDASHIQDLQNEVSAVVSGLRGTITHALTLGSVLNVSGASTLATLQAGASTLASLNVTGGSTFAGGLSVSSLAVSSNLSVGGALSGDLSTFARVTVSSVAGAAPLANTIYGENICHAHAVVSSTPGVVLGFNVSSATSPGAGRAAIAFGTAMNSSNYTPIVTTNHPSVGALLFVTVSAKASTGFEVGISSQSGSAGLCPFGVMVMGRG
jgi:hypothetical protein